MKIYGGVEVGLHLFLNFALNGGGWSAALLKFVTSGKEPQRLAGRHSRPGSL